MARTTMLIILVLAMSGLAQDWQWEQYTGDYRNPTGFAECFYVTGDFDGNGTDEPLDIAPNGWRCWLHDEQVGGFHWLPPISGSDTLNPHYGSLTAFDLDGDGADELIIFGSNQSIDTLAPTVWKLVSTDPWSWERHDELITPWIEDFAEYYTVLSAVFVDIDNDGLMNLVCDVPYDCLCTGLDIWEYDSAGHATLEYTYMNHHWKGLRYIAGDFDRDGDDDFVIHADSFYTSGDAYATLLIENTGNGVAEPVLISTPNCEPWSAGDLNGDGLCEMVLWDRRDIEPYNHVTPYSLQFYLAYLDDDLQIQIFLDPSPFRGRILGNLRPTNGTNAPVAGTANWYRETHDETSFGTIEQYYTSDGWKTFESGIKRNGVTLATSFYDLSQELYPSLLQVFETYHFGILQREWEAYKLLHMTDGDYFSLTYGYYYLEQFYLNQDTLFYSPQLGQITGDDVTEIIMLAEYDNQPSRILFYEFHWLYYDELIPNAGLSSGLPAGVEAIRVIDLDGDGVSEIFTRNNSVNWSLYYLEGAAWQDYSNILPDFESAELGFADFDNDGNIDIFTDNDVWLSLSPSPSSDDFILQPSSIALSAYPNPFNPTTTLRVALPEAGTCSLDIYNIRGQLVETLIDRPLTAGEHQLTFDGSALPSGVYFAELSTSERTAVHKLLLLK